MYKNSRFKPADLQTGKELLCLVVCMTLLASFFLPSHLSFKHVHLHLLCTHVHVHMYMYI